MHTAATAVCMCTAVSDLPVAFLQLHGQHCCCVSASVPCPHRRGTRPAEVPQVDIRRSFAPREAANPAGGYAAGWQEQRMRTELFPAAAAAVSDTAPAVAAATSSSSGALASGQEQQQALQAGSQLGAAAAATASTGPVFNASELQELLSILPGSPSQQQQQQVQEPEQQQAAAAEDRYKKLGPYGPGLINRLIALEDAGEV